MAQWADGLRQAIAEMNLDDLAATTDERALLRPLADAVAFARYWQEPDAEDQALTDPQVREALLPLAAAVAAAPAADWWHTSVGLENQQCVQWLDEPYGQPPLLSGASAELARWQQHTLAEEARSHDRPAEPTANFGGQWWSAPVWPARLISTTRALPGIPAAGLVLVEDEQGNEEARCWPLRPTRAARVYEITGPQDWVTLAAQYPLVVDRSRRHDWWRATGWSGGWRTPYWSSVAVDYDAVHLSVAGYLHTAGRAPPVGDEARSLLAGWNPDATYWLTDILTPNGSTSDWTAENYDDVTRWTRRDR